MLDQLHRVDNTHWITLAALPHTQIGPHSRPHMNSQRRHGGMARVRETDSFLSLQAEHAYSISTHFNRTR